MAGDYSASVGPVDPADLSRPPQADGTYSTVKSVSGPGNDPDKPDFLSSFYRDQAGRWRMISNLWDGTEAMRIAGEHHLPRYVHEAQDVWKRRIAFTTLLNYFRKTVSNYVGKPFGRPLIVPKEMPEQLVEYFKDVDGHGMSLDMFAQLGFEKGLAKGIVHCFVDYPKADEGETVADEDDRNPIMCIIEPEAVLGARADDDGDIAQIRILESKKEPDGKFGEECANYIRVLEPGKWSLYKQANDGKQGSAIEWKLVGQGDMTLQDVPVASFLADKEGFMHSRPPLLDLAYKNVEHWQSCSDQRNILTVCRFPILVGTGINPQDAQTIGPNSFWGLRDPAASLKWVEITGQAISAGRQDLEDLKAEMSVLGLALLMPQKSGDPTATAKALDGAEAITELQRIVMSYEQFLNQCIQLVAEWMELPDPDKLPRVTVNSDYTKLLSIDSSVQALLTVRAAGDISRPAIIAALKRRNLLPADFDEDADEEELKKEEAQAPQGLPPAMPGKPGLGMSLGGKPGAKKPAGGAASPGAGKSPDGTVTKVTTVEAQPS